jgi:hypothetical protein
VATSRGMLHEAITQVSGEGSAARELTSFTTPRIDSNITG